MTEDKRPENPDEDKVETLINTLRRYPQGIWLRKLSRESSVPLSTVHYYINNVIDPFIVSRGAKDSDGNYFGIRLIKLKDGIKNHLDSGRSVTYLMKTKDILTENT